jgi:hypothetical protein
MTLAGLRDLVDVLLVLDGNVAWLGWFLVLVLLLGPIARVDAALVGPTASFSDDVYSDQTIGLSHEDVDTVADAGAVNVLLQSQRRALGQRGPYLAAGLRRSGRCGRDSGDL